MTDRDFTTAPQTDFLNKNLWPAESPQPAPAENLHDSLWRQTKAQAAIVAAIIPVVRALVLRGSR